MHASRSIIPAFVLVAGTAAKSVWTTPHDSYSSSVGVLGCKINTDRVAYWPGSIDCDNICVKLSYGGRSVHLLRIDQSGGAYDISYDAWNYLQTGESAATDPISGGNVEMDYEEVDASECADLIHTPGSKLPLSASNSMNFLTECLSQPGSYVARNHVLYNICDAICTLGYDEECTLDLATSNQPSCKHTLGLTSPLTTAPVYNIQYESCDTVVAGTGEKVAPGDRVNGGGYDSGSGAGTDPSPGVFVEQKTTTTAAASSYGAASVEPSSSAVKVPTAVPTTYQAVTTEIPTGVPSTYQAATTADQTTLNTSAGKPSTYVATTLSKATISSSPTTASGGPSGTPTGEVVNSGQARLSVTALPLVSSMLVLLILAAC
jgi:hypothetical protein